MKSYRLNLKFAVLLFILLLCPNLVWAQESPKEVLRFSGSDRFETAIKISQKLATNSDIVLIANAFNYPDSLAGSVLSAGKYPLLFSDRDRLTDATREELRALNPRMIILLGGETQLSEEVERELLESYEVLRLGGKDRYETMKLIRNYDKKKNVILTSGESFADSLSATPLAITGDANIVLTPKAFASPYTLDALDQVDGMVRMIGGESAITESTRQAILKVLEADTIESISGANRYETSIEIAKQFFSDTVILASGESFPDSLSGSVLAGQIECPIILTPKDRLNASVIEYFKEHVDQIQTVIILGGEHAVSEKVQTQVNRLLLGESLMDESDFGNTLQSFRIINGYGTVHQNWDLSSEVVDEVYQGLYVKVYGETEGILKIRSGNQVGYINASIADKIQDPNMFKVVDGILIVNKQFYLPSDYNYGYDTEALNAFHAMQQAMWNSGVGCYLESGYRSYWYQQVIHNNFIWTDGEWAAKRYSAEPGHSEHQAGLAFDISSYGEGVVSSFQWTSSFYWLQENAKDYGFILRYAADKEGVTGYMYEPWHYRYVGVEHARKIEASGLSVEEYYQLVP